MCFFITTSPGWRMGWWHWDVSWLDPFKNSPKIGRDEVDREIRMVTKWASNISDWLVVDLPLWKIWKSAGVTIPNIWKIKNVPNHQPDEINLFFDFFRYITIGNVLRPQPYPFSLIPLGVSCMFHGAFYVGNLDGLLGVAGIIILWIIPKNSLLIKHQ